MRVSMYDQTLFQKRMVELGLSPYQLSLLAGINHRTAKTVITTGAGHPKSIYKVARALGFPVKKTGTKRTGMKYNFRSIMRKTAA